MDSLALSIILKLLIKLEILIVTRSVFRYHFWDNIITASLCFKFGAAPFHIWVPDIYQGSLISTTILLSTLPKIAVFIVFLKLYFIPFMALEYVWSDILIFIGIASIIIGSIFALTQENIKDF